MYAPDVGSTLCIRGSRCGGSATGPKNSTPSSRSQATVCVTFSVSSRRSSRLSRAADAPANFAMSSK